MDEAENLLFADFYVWDDSSTGQGHQDVACDEYHVPAHVQDHIDYVTPGVRLRHGSADRGGLQKRGKMGLKDGKNFKGGPVKTRPNDYIGPAYPGTNSTSCSQYVTADCIRGKSP